MLRIELDRLGARIGSWRAPTGGAPDPSDLEVPVLQRALDHADVLQLRTVQCLASLERQLKDLGTRVAVYLDWLLKQRAQFGKIEYTTVRPWAQPDFEAMSAAVGRTLDVIALLREEVHNELAPEPDLRDALVSIYEDRSTDPPKYFSDFGADGQSSKP